MALEKRTVIDKIEIIGELNHVQVREALQILEDDVVISQSYNRYVVSPGEDFSTRDEKVKTICAVVHTETVVTAFEQHLASQEVPV